MGAGILNAEPAVGIMQQGLVPGRLHLDIFIIERLVEEAVSRRGPDILIEPRLFINAEHVYAALGQLTACHQSRRSASHHYYIIISHMSHNLLL